MNLSGVPIVFVNNFPGPRMGGGEVHLMHLAAGARDAGMAVTIVAMPSSGLAETARRAGLEVIEDDLMRRGASRRVTSVLAPRGASIVHGTGYYTNLVARLAGPPAAAAVVNAVHTEPRASAAAGGLRASLANRARRLADALTRSRADVQIADSRALADAMVRDGADPERVRVVHNGVDPAAVREEASRGPVPPELSEAEECVGTVGRLEPVKGLRVLLDAASILAEGRPGTRFFIAGDGPERQSLRARIDGDRLLSGRVTMLGFVDNAYALMKELDIYCLPSLSEGFNTTVLEAMALGTPVVATDVGGMSEAVVEGVTGRLVSAGDPDGLALAIAGMLEDRARARAMAQAAIVRVEGEFTVDRMVRGTLEIYQELLIAREAGS